LFFIIFANIKILVKNNTIMALETRPFPVLTGKAARDFLKKVENFKTDETREHVREVNNWVRKSMEELRQREKKNV